MTTAIICTAILAALLFVLGFNVSRMRGVTAKQGGSQMPTDPASPLPPPPPAGVADHLRRQRAAHP